MNTQPVRHDDEQGRSRVAAEEARVALPPGAALNQMIWGYTISQAVHVAAKLGIVDVLCDAPKTAREIADAVGAHEPALRRLLRALTTVDILVEDGAGRFAATTEGDVLRTDHPQSLRAWALAIAPLGWRAWGDLYESVVTGMPAVDRIYGESFFAYLGRRPEEAAVFNAAMTSGSRHDVPAILAAYDFAGCTRIVDVGGGQGALLQGILERYPQATGVLFDLPPVVEAQALKDSAVAARCELVGGDMFHAVPAGGDAYILRHILHDWSDAEALQILRNCRRAIADQGKLVVVEFVVKPSNEPDFAKWLDLNMLVLLTGRERTNEEFRDLYAAAGFRLTRIMATGGTSIVEGIPV